MPWSSNLLSLLSSPPYRLAWKLETLAVNDSPGIPGYIASSIPGIGDPIIGRGGVRVNGSTLTPGTWSTTLGGFTVDLCGDLSGIKAAATRGTYIGLYLGGIEWSSSDYELVITGQVQQLTARSPNHATLTCRDLLSALRCRATTDAGRLPVAYRLSVPDTALTATYSPGDSSLSIADTSGYDLPPIGGILACMVSPSSGDPFVLTYTGVSGGGLTGVSSVGRHGTTASAAAIGDTVRPLLWINEHPINVARKVLLSVNGAGVNTYDALPSGDGLALQYDWIDHSDSSSYLSISEPTVTWEIVETNEIDNPIEWLRGILAAGGFYLTVRQGKLTTRAAVPSVSGLVSDAAEITDDDIESGGITWEAWNQDAPSEACIVTVTSNNRDTTSSGVENPATLPAFYRKDYDLTGLLFTDEPTGRLDVTNRTYEAHLRIPERYTLSCVGLRLAQLTPGDLVRVTSRQIAGRLSATLEGLNQTRGMVTQVSPDFGAGRVSLVVLVYPTSDAVFP